MFNCRLCGNEFKSQRALSGHMRIHSGIKMKVPDRILCSICQRSVSKIWIEKHIFNHKKSNCLECGKEIYDRKFCNSRCSAKYSNRNRKGVKYKIIKNNKAKFVKIKLPYKISDETRKKLSIARIQSIKNGNTNFKSKKCKYIFNNKIIECDSKIEYSCLNYFEKTFDVIDINRCDFEIVYVMYEKEKLFLPDFKILTSSGQYIVECKSDTVSKSLNKKWHFYKESAALKKVALENYCTVNNLFSFWYTKKLNRKFYNSLKF